MLYPAKQEAHFSSELAHQALLYTSDADTSDKQDRDAGNGKTGPASRAANYHNEEQTEEENQPQSYQRQ